MKNLSFICLFSFALFFSCEKELHKYEGKSTIYFEEAGRLPSFSTEVIKDSTIISFSVSKAQDSIVRMVISSIGATSQVDRKYTLQVNPNSTAKQGVHFDYIDSDFVIKKDQLRDTFYVKFFRVPAMQTESFTLLLDLVENDNFSTNMKNKVLNSTLKKSHSFITYKWYVNDIILRPMYWFDHSLGTFSRKKLFLMVDVLGIEAAYMYTQVPLAEVTAFGKFMNRYLNDQKNAGQTVYEDDGITEMTMGAGSQ